jgi:hypothetical protein
VLETPRPAVFAIWKGRHLPPQLAGRHRHSQPPMYPHEDTLLTLGSRVGWTIANSAGGQPNVALIDEASACGDAVAP